jgi:LysM repeat protein
MALLKASINPSGNSTGGADINIVDGEALLPETGPTGNAGVDVIQPKNDQISIYVVREGDSLSQIAQMFGVSINTIVWANDIKQGGRIAPGQTLVILPVSGVRYTVKKGDTLASIAKVYKGDLAEITDFNNLTSDSVLAIGDIVIIPDGEINSASSAGTSSLIITHPGPSIDGYFINPVPGAIKTQGLHGYNAVDLGAPVGKQILAAASGTVIVAKEGGWNGGYGSYIVIKHNNGTQTLYSHASKVIVSVGQVVVQGQVIGYVGSTGKSTGPHVHFEVRGAVNPMNSCVLNSVCR